MPGVNFTGGRRNAARQRSRDVMGQKQRDHFQRQRRYAFFKPEPATTSQPGATNGPQGPHGINLAHAQNALRRHPDYDEKSRSNVQSYSIPQAHGILHRSPHPSPSRKRARSSRQQNDLEDEADAFEAMRRRLMGAQNLVGLVRRIPRKIPTSSTMSSSPSNQGQSERVVEQILDHWPLTNPSTGSASEQDSEPQHKAFIPSPSSPDGYATSPHSVSGSASALIADPWVALQMQTRIELSSGSSSPWRRDLTFPPREGFDIPECAGLDFRLARYSPSPDRLHPFPPEDEDAVGSPHAQSPVQDSLPLPNALDYLLNCRTSSEEEAPAVDALSYWLDDTDDGNGYDTTADVSIPPATMPEAHAPVRTVVPFRHPHSGIDEILALLPVIPLAHMKSSDSHTIVASSSPAPRVSHLPTAVSEDRLVPPPPLCALADLAPTQGERSCSPLKNMTPLRAPDQQADNARPLLNARPSTQLESSTPPHTIIDNIIASAFPSLAPSSRLPNNDQRVSSESNDAMKRSSKLDSEVLEKPRNGDMVDASPVSGIELKFFFSLWDDDDEDE